MYNSKY